MRKFKTIIFDLDGVLIDSRLNMLHSWNSVRKKLKIKQTFKKYFKFVGHPFEKILKKIGIKDNYHLIKEVYNYNSIKNKGHIKPYKGLKNILNQLLKKKIKLAIVTSKDLNRTKLFVKKFKIPIKVVISPKKSMKGKPFPDQLNLAIKRLKSKRKSTCYVGDMKIDYDAASNAKIAFIFAKYGYGKKKKNYNYSLKKLKDILKFV